MYDERVSSLHILWRHVGGGGALPELKLLAVAEIGAPGTFVTLPCYETEYSYAAFRRRSGYVSRGRGRLVLR